MNRDGFFTESDSESLGSHWNKGVVLQYRERARRPQTLRPNSIVIAIILPKCDA